MRVLSVTGSTIMICVSSSSTFSWRSSVSRSATGLHRARCFVKATEKFLYFLLQYGHHTFMYGFAATATAEPAELSVGLSTASHVRQ